MRVTNWTLRVSLSRLLLAVLLLAAIALPGAPVQAAADDGFALQVSPSPLVASLTPGKQTTLTLQIRNTNTKSQDLKMGLRTFGINPTSGQVTFGKSAPADVAGFVHFADPAFSLQPGQIFSQTITIDTPADAGFTYSFAIIIGQQHPPKAQGSTSAIQGSVAVFTLLSVDRPGATRKLELQQFSVSRHVYAYLPATLNLKFKNTGNTLVQPTGTIFIQRHSDDKQPLATIPLNQTEGYILPATSRSLSTTWNDGYPHYISVSQPGGGSKQQLSWQGSDITKLRFGHYVAKVVAVYNDGQRDVPLNAEVGFWVIPWQPLLVIIFIILLLLVGLVTILRKSSRAIRHRSGKLHVKTKA